VLDPDNATVTISAEYKSNGGAWTSMTNTSGNIGAGVDAVPSHFRTARTIVWRAKTQLTAGNDTLYYVRVMASDGTNKDTAESAIFRIDTKPPTGLGSFTSSEVTGSTITLTWTAASDRVFQEYTIWYGTTQSDVQNRTGSAQKWDKTKDAALAAAPTTSTTITGLTPGGNYFWKIWAADSVGNEATVADVNIPTPQMVSTQWSRTFVGPVTGGAVQENSIYVGTGGSENTLFSIKLGDGTTRWSYITSAYGVCNMPTYIYSGKAGGKYRVTASAGYYVICRQDEGNSSSEIFTPVNLGAAAGNPYANPDDSTFTVVYGNNVVRKKITNGTTLSGWPVALSNASRLADPVVFNDEAFVATTDGVVKKYYMDGTPGPQVNVGAAVNLPLLIDDSTLFVSPNNDTLYAFRMATMAQKWKIKIGGTNSGPAFSLSYGKGSPSRIIYAAASKKVQRITDNGASASIDWTYDAADTVASGPIIFNGTVYFGRNGGRYYAITDNGTSASLVNKWPYTGSSGNANVGPWMDITNNRAIFGSTGGKLDAFTLP
jgi:hypothetical protein